MSVIKVNSIQHSGAANASIELNANGRVAFSNTVSIANDLLLGGNTVSPFTSAGREIVDLFGSTDSVVVLRNPTGNTYLQRFSTECFLNNQTGNTFLTTGQSVVFQAGGNERMRIDSSGRVTTPNQPHIRGGISRSTQSAGVGNLFYQRSAIGLSFSTDRITVPVAGVYMITWMTIAETNIGRYDANLLVNGSTICSALNEANGDGYHQKTLSISVNLSASDYIQFYNQRWYSINSDPGEWSQLSVTLLG